MVFGTRENHEGRFLLENGLDGYIFWVLVVMGGLDLAACDTSQLVSQAAFIIFRACRAAWHYQLGHCDC
jgi:hypothetical protein